MLKINKTHIFSNNGLKRLCGLPIERKLRATWTVEMAQDVSAFHNIDAEAELISMLNQNVAREIDNQILRDLRTAGHITNYKPLSNEELLCKISQATAQIQRQTTRGSANWIVCSPEIANQYMTMALIHNRRKDTFGLTDYIPFLNNGLKKLKDK